MADHGNRWVGLFDEWLESLDSFQLDIIYLRYALDREDIQNLQWPVLRMDICKVLKVTLKEAREAEEAALELLDKLIISRLGLAINSEDEEEPQWSEGDDVKSEALKALAQTTQGYPPASISCILREMRLVTDFPFLYPPQHQAELFMEAIQNEPDKFKEKMTDWASLISPELESPIEERLWHELTNSGIVARTQVDTGSFRTDQVLKLQAYFGDAGTASKPRVIIECDGKGWHHRLVDDFRDDELYRLTRLPICHITGKSIYWSPQMCTLKIIDIFFPEVRQTANYRYLLIRLARSESQFNTLMRHSKQNIGRSLYSASDNDDVKAHKRVQRVLDLFEKELLNQFSMQDFHEGWIYPHNSSPYSALDKREELRKSFNNQILSPRDYARHYIMRFYTGDRQRQALAELDDFLKRTTRSK
jgi:hypothetical protein